MAEPKELHANQEEGSADEAGMTHYEHIGRVLHDAIHDGDHHAIGRALHDAHKTFAAQSHDHPEPDGDEGERPNLAMLLLRRKRH